ncbi:hypothetical protein EDC04DRAFT_2601895 [Pisolithus marmoratus]|nr:hypothetical protein EDC04DRAFT_2601895 [Pisolithus marmoratus]
MQIARRLLGPNLDLEEEDDEYEPDTLTEEEEEEEDADVDPDSPSWEVDPEAGEGIFERMITTVSKCQPSIAPFRRHPNGVTPTSDAGIGKTRGANGDEYSHFTCSICYQPFPSKSKCNPHKRRECQESGTIVDSFGVTITLTHQDGKFYCCCSNHASSPTPYATIPALSKHLQKVKAAWIGPEGTDQQDGEPCPEEDKEWRGQQEQEAHPNPNSPIVNYEEEETSEEEAQNKAKAQEEEEEKSEEQDHKGTTNFGQGGKREAIIMEDEDEDEDDEDVNVNVDVDMDMDLDVDVDEDDEDEDEQEQEQEWEQEHEQEQEQEQEQEEPPSGFLYHPYLDTINLKVNWEFRFLIYEVCKEAIKKQDVIGHVQTHKLKVDPSQLAKATDQLKVVSDFPTIKGPHLPVKGLPLHVAFACYCSSYLGIYIYSFCTNHTVTIFVQMDHQ